MKKNIAMRVAAFLFILTMISTCAFATTFAKYTTSDSANDSARVAKWGVNVDVAANPTGMFQSSYVGVDSAHGNTVATTESTKLIAPGTSVTDALTVTITGTPEVDVEIKYEATVELTDWEFTYTVDGETKTTYCPLVITVGTESFKVGDTGITNAATLAAAVKAEIEKKSAANIDANTPLTTNNDLKISWSWAYEVEGTDAEKAAANANDTALGTQAANGTAPTISITVKCTVTQID